MCIRRNVEGDRSGKNTSGRVLDPAWNEVLDRNLWCENFVADIVLQESTHTFLTVAHF